MILTNTQPRSSREDAHSQPPDRSRVLERTNVIVLGEDVQTTVIHSKQPEETNTRAPYFVRVPRIVRLLEYGLTRFTLLQKWEGVVIEANEETFTSRLIDCHGELGEQQATFSNSELSPEERNQIEVGASFVWTIGYRHIGATRHRDSMIYFRRLPPWSVDELDVAKWKGEKLGRAISWE